MHERKENEHTYRQHNITLLWHMSYIPIDKLILILFDLFFSNYTISRAKNIVDMEYQDL